MNIQTLYINPGSPWENGYAESFHSRLSDEFLSMEVFDDLASARRLTAIWKHDYNHVRPHSSLGYIPPIEFAARCAASVPTSATPPSPLQQHNELTQTCSS